jgi:hypothetical protein
MKRVIFFFVFLITLGFQAQNIQFVNAKKQALEGILLINDEGKMIGITDSEGNIPENALGKSQFILLNQRNLDQDTIWIKDIKENQVIVRNIREQIIPEIVIDTKKEFLTITGYFTSYVVNTGEFNIFVDGIMEVVLDRKTNKLKKTLVKEYRSFILEDTKTDHKVVSSIVFDNLTELPKLEDLPKILNESTEKKKTNAANGEINYEQEKSLFTKKEFKLFGFVFKDFFIKVNYTFDKDPATNKNLVQYNRTISAEIKHKTENEFAHLQIYSNFYPQDIGFKNKNEWEDGVKFNKEKSQYKTQYWLNEENASIYRTLSSHFKENFKLQN